MFLMSCRCLKVQALSFILVSIENKTTPPKGLAATPQLCLPVLSSIQKDNLLPRKRSPGQSPWGRGEGRAQCTAEHCCLCRADPANPARAGILRGAALALLWSLVPNRSGNPQLQRCRCCPSHWVLMVLAVYQLPTEMQVTARSSGVFLEKLCFLHHVPGKPWLYCLRHHHKLQ